MLHTLFLLAEGAPAPQGPPSWFMMPLILGFIILYFVFMRPGRGGDADRKALLSSLKKNDKIVTIAGMFGTVVSVAEKEDEVVVQIDSNVRVKMRKSAIAQNLTNEEAYKAAKEKGKDAKAAVTPSPAEGAVTTTPKT